MRNIAVFVIAFNLFICACTVPQIDKNAIINNEPMDIPLVPFFWQTKEKYLYTKGFGYLNSETLEIIINAQYHTAKNFTGNFAVVQKKEAGKYSIINKNNIEVMKNFDNAYLYQLDNGTVLALTLNYHGWNVYDTGLFGRGYAQGPDRVTYRLYNLNNGILLKVDNRSSSEKDIIIIDDYIIYYDRFNEYLDIYEIGGNGKLENIDITVEDFFEKIIQENNLQYKENNFYSYASDKGYPYGYKIIPDKSDKYTFTRKWVDIKFYFHSLDINEIIKIIPDNMKFNIFDVNTRSNSIGATIKYDIDLINWDETYPFKKKNYLYRIGLVSYESGEEKEYNGLYDPSNNSWVTPPLEGSGNFHIIDDNWVVYELYEYECNIYNTITKESHAAAYIGRSTLSPGRSGYYLYFSD
jgi:hypothetical protein